MIGRLSGIVAEITEEEALIDVGGVGYVVRCGARTLTRLPALGDEAVLHIESQWGEATGLRLYGFLSRDERGAFVQLLNIQGVGPKAALAVLDVLPPGELAAAVSRQDRAAVSRASGVGPKLAIRIVTELKDKPIGGVLISAGAVIAHGAPAAPPPASAAGEAVAGLMGLGINEVQARRVVEQAVIRFGEDADVPTLIKAALQELGR
jgi:Holliday junction DNA helicase RuvA